MENIIEITDYSFSYQKHLIINNLNLNIKKGSFTTLVGNTGGGKTTLVKLITGLLKGKGEIKIFNKAIDDSTITDNFIKEIGVVLGNPYDNFVSSTVKDDLIFPLENLQLKKNEIDKYLSDIVSYFKIEDLLDTNPMDLTVSDASVVALASALITKPKLLILDDAFIKMNTIVKKEKLLLLKDLKKRFNISIFNITHDINEIMYGDYAVLMHNGSIVLVHRPERLIEIIEEMKKNNIEPKKVQFIYPKKNSSANIMLIEGSKNGNPGLKILPPIYTHEENGEYTKEIKKYFE